MKKYTLYDMIVKRIVRTITLFAAALMALCCDDFVDVDQPNSQLTGPVVFEDNATATAAMTDIYSKIRDMGLLTGKSLGISALLGVYTDELVSYQIDNFSTEPFYNNNVLVTNGPVQEIWVRTYNQIYAANAVIEGVSQSGGISQDDKNILIGEALFVRALLHSYLAGIYGGCPYVITTDYATNSTVSRLAPAVVYDLCIIDLEQAAELLPADYVSMERVRPNRFAAMALLARTLLYSERWAEASNMASAVLNESGMYVWETDLNKVFLKESTSIIWQLKAGGGFANSQEAATFIFDAGPPPTVALRSELYDAFEAGDLRREEWIRVISDGNSEWYHAYKYKQGLGTFNPLENSVMLRLAEQFLIRAEARARQGEIIGALEDLNIVRQRAGLSDLMSNDGTVILEAIIKERRFEFFTEMGMRFFDLQRTNLLDSILAPLKPGWNSTDRYWPVPQSEMLINPNLEPQNPGY